MKEIHAWRYITKNITSHVIFSDYCFPEMEKGKGCQRKRQRGISQRRVANKPIIMDRPTTSAIIQRILNNHSFFLVVLRPNAGHGLRFLDHSQRRTTVGRTPLDEWPACRRDFCLTTHNTHNRQTSIPPAGFEPTISAGKRPQTYALDRAATGIHLLIIKPTRCTNSSNLFLE